MNRFFIPLFLVFIFCILAISDVAGQAFPIGTAAASPTTEAAPAVDAIAPPPDITYQHKPQGSHFLSADEFGLSFMVLAFGVFVFFLQFFLIRQKLFSPNQSIRAMIITLVIIASLFLISAGFTSDQITPIIGLLGTIVGYLLGSNQATLNEKTES